MKKSLLILFSVVSLSLQAQITRIDTVNTSNIKLNTSQFKNPRLFMYTIGIKAYSLEEFPKVLNQVNSNDYTTTKMSGIFVKLNDNQISYRISGNFYSDDISFKNECEECEEAQGKLKDFSAKIGFEKNFIYGMIQPYLAFDLGYRRNAFDGKVQNASTINYTNPYEINSLKNGLIMSPNFGLKFNPVNHLTLAIETGIGLLYSYEKQERIYQDANRTRTFSEFRKWEFLLNPVSMFSVQYNFGVTY
ncbi:hypothetical protein WG906_07570 [Pedobacter sp. P351]|uniref:hypothetical protein n=1 Tax=Pedobacter superstes TaxID=3133441 RepID=UPI00309AF665